LASKTGQKSLTGYDSIVGHKIPARILNQLAETDRVPGTLLFSGPPGIGKLAAAIQFAKNLNCEKSREPLCDCYSCSAIRTGAHPYILVISKPGQIKVDEMREIVSLASMKTASGSKRVFIFDNADVITTEASNAALKILEEPGTDLYFVLISDSPYSIISTVRSRSYKIRFSNLSDSEMRVFADTLEKGKPEDGIEHALEYSNGSPGIFLMWAYNENYRDLISELREWMAEWRKGKRLSISEALKWKEAYKDYANRLSSTEREIGIPRGANVFELKNYYSEVDKLRVDTLNWKADQQGSSKGQAMGLKLTGLAMVLRRLLHFDNSDESGRGILVLQEFAKKIDANCQQDMLLERLYYSVHEG
jgi:hypothetical protein